MVTARLAIEVVPLSSATELAPQSVGTQGVAWDAGFNAFDFNAGQSRPTLSSGYATTRYLFATVGSGLGEVVEYDGEEGPVAYADWDARTMFSQSAAVEAVTTLPAVSGLIVSTRAVPADVALYPSAAEGDTWASVRGELEAERGSWPGRSEP